MASYNTIIPGYLYGTSVINGVRYAIIKLDDSGAIQRVREMKMANNPVIWQAGDEMTPAILNILSEARYGMDSLHPWPRS